MDLSRRVALSAAIVVVDVVAFALPLTAFAIAYVLVARPRWFLEWTIRVYGGAVPGADRM